QYLDAPYRDGNFRESHNSHVPDFQRPLVRKNVAGRTSAGRRKSFDDNQLISWRDVKLCRWTSISS
ncbi:CLIP-associated protein, partial [Trifolium medium]|nr:CLIP-associated protein [Trifolium medium]